MTCESCDGSLLRWMCPDCNRTGKKGKWVEMYGQKVWVTLCPPVPATDNVFFPTMSQIDSRLREYLPGYNARVLPAKGDQSAFEGTEAES